MRRQGHGSLTTPTACLPACPSVYLASPKEHHRQKGSMEGIALKADTILMYWLNYNDYLLPAATTSPPCLVLVHAGGWLWSVPPFYLCCWPCSLPVLDGCSVFIWGVRIKSFSFFFLVSCKKQTPCNDGFQTWPIILLLVILLVWGPCVSIVPFTMYSCSVCGLCSTFDGASIMCMCVDVEGPATQWPTRPANEWADVSN